MQQPLCTLNLFARAPEPGRVKTRLWPLLGPDGAASLYRAFLEDASHAYQKPEAWLAVLSVDGEPNDPELVRLFPPPWRRERQEEGDLGARLSRAFVRSFSEGAAFAAAVGSDHPALPRQSLNAAFAALGMDWAYVPLPVAPPPAPGPSTWICWPGSGWPSRLVSRPATVTGAPVASAPGRPNTTSPVSTATRGAKEPLNDTSRRSRTFPATCTTHVTRSTSPPESEDRTAVAFNEKTDLSHLDQPAEQQAWDIALTTYSDSDNFPVFNFYYWFAIDGPSDWVMAPRELRRLYEETLRTVDRDKQTALMQQMERLTRDQALFYFLTGFTAKLAGTEIGVTEPQPTFSCAFGAPFLPQKATVYARMLGQKLDEHGSAVWLVNTGWTGGAYGEGQRMPIAATRALLRAALDGDLDQVEYRVDPIFGFEVPVEVPGVDSNLLDPRSTWSDPDAYDEKARYLATRFRENFQKFGADENIVQAGPRV